MRWPTVLLLACVAVMATGADISHADKKKQNKDHPWYPDCVGNFNVCHDVACNFPGDPVTSGKNECQADCLNELSKCLGPASRKRLETGVTGGNSGVGADPGPPKPQTKPKGKPPMSSTSPN